MPADNAANSSRDETGKRHQQPVQAKHAETQVKRLAGEFLGATLLVPFHAGIATSSRVLQAASGQPKTGAGVIFIALSRDSRSSPALWW
jgi:hypothetical protein